MLDDRGRRTDLERASLRLRLAAIALAATILTLSVPSDPAPAGAALLAYAIVAALTRLVFPRVDLPALAVVATGIDLLFATALVILLPPSAAAWTLYAFAIGVAGLRSGAPAAAIATAATIVLYDAALILRAPAARATDLWPVQVLLAFGLLVAELVWALARSEAERRRLHDALAGAARDSAARGQERDRLAREIGQLRALTDRLQEQLRERDDAVASAVHELRTPLTSVQAYGQLMSRNLQAVQRQVEQLERLISDLLRMPGTRPLAADAVDLAREAREAAHRLSLIAEVEVEVEVSVDDEAISHEIRGDAGRLGQVLDNLLRNAAKFSPPGQPISVSVRRDGTDVLVAVTDRGAGIPTEELPLIFERHYRGREHRRTVPGEGIGLAVSREIVVAHGGRIWAMSPGPGRGSTFFIALPTLEVAEAHSSGATGLPMGEETA